MQQGRRADLTVRHSTMTRLSIMPTESTEIKMPEYISVDDFAQMLSISRRWAMELLRSGKGPERYKFGKKVMVRIEDFESWKESCKVPTEK